MLFIDKKLKGLHDNYSIIPISDAHDGERRFNREKLIEVVTRIKEEENTYGILLGDLCNNATKNSKSDVYSDTMSPQEQKEDIEDILSNIQYKLLGATSGNHEDRSWRESASDITRDIAKYLHIPYDPFSLYIQINCGKVNTGSINYTIFATHGNGGGSTKGAKANAMHKLKDIALADLYFMGHLHDTITFKDVLFVPDTRHKRMTKQIRHFAMAGSYLDYGGYAERACYAPNLADFPVAVLNGTKKQIKIIT